MSTSLLDAVGGEQSRRAATGLLAFGVVTALPAVATGLAEWADTTGPTRRVGALHAAANGTAFLAYTASLIARLCGCHGTAARLGLLGLLVASVGGYLGGHLTLVLKVGSRDRALLPE